MNHIKIDLPLIKATEQRLIPTHFVIQTPALNQRPHTRVSFAVFNENNQPVDTAQVTFSGEEHDAIIQLLAPALPQLIALVQQKMGVPSDKLVVPRIEDIVAMFKNPVQEEPTQLRQSTEN